MDAEHVGLAQKALEAVHAPEPEAKLRARRAVGVEENHLHPERFGAERGRCADAAKTEHTEREAGETPHRRRAEEVPASREIELQRVVEGDDAASQGKHHGDRVIGDVSGAVVRRVADGDGAGSGGGDVDLIESHSGAHDLPTAGEAGDQRRVDRDVETYNRIAVAPERPRNLAGFLGAVDVQDRVAPEHLLLQVGGADELGVGIKNVETHFAPRAG